MTGFGFARTAAAAARYSLVAAVCVLGLWSCASSSPSAKRQAQGTALTGASASEKSPQASQSSSRDEASEPDPDALSQADQERLEALYKKRTTSAPTGDYPIGPGDVVQISVPAIDELKDRVVRVGGDGTFSLPLIDTIQAAGLTEAQLRDEIREKVKKYMYNPQVDLFVKQYRSREVAVVGAVMGPGLQTLVSPSETILDVLTQAGGMRHDAADQIIFIPAEEIEAGAARRFAELSAEKESARSKAELEGMTAVSNSERGTRKEARSSAAEGASESDFLSLIPANARPIFISFRSSSMSGGGKYVNMPVRPGDVIVVPGGGDVMIVGWVQSPGHFPVGSGLTVLGAVGAAGGPMYAADTSDVHLIRTNKDGRKVVLTVNLDKIEAGQENDLKVQGNDVLEVPYAKAKIAPYILYQMLIRMGIPEPGFPAM